MNRCEWVGEGKPEYVRYHDEEWGVPVHCDQKHFEMLILEGAQAGLNWETILKKRQAYRDLFYNFSPLLVAKMSDDDLEKILLNPAIIRNRRKIFSVRQNALIFIKIVEEFGSFDEYVWRFVGAKPKINRPLSKEDVPSSSIESLNLSKDLKKRGMSFVGPTIIYAYMQAVGLVNDHIVSCFVNDLD